MSWSWLDCLDSYGDALNPPFDSAGLNDALKTRHVFDLRDVDVPPDEYGLLGRRQDNRALYVDVHAPFCAVAVGLQGAGKSHTINVLLENCMMPTTIPGEWPVVKLETPMSALVFHYGTNPMDVCEAVGLATPRLDCVQGCTEITLMVSPTFYKQRRQLYNAMGYQVVPLLFRWDTLDAVQLRRLMRLGDSDTQLYADVMLGILKKYQRENEIPPFDEFKQLVLEECKNPAQAGPLKQRFGLLCQFVYEADENADLRKHAVNSELACVAGCGRVVVADLTDPMISAADANGVFQVLLAKYRALAMDCGKVLLCDEAHRYFGGKARGLEDLVVDAVRLMRHEGMRVVVSTQSPVTLPAELLELSTMVVCHRFQSPEWYRYLSSTIALPADGFAQIQALDTGYAMLVGPGIKTCMMHVRHRLTTDRGATITNGQFADTAAMVVAATQKRTVVTTTTRQKQDRKAKDKKKKKKGKAGVAPGHKK